MTKDVTEENVVYFEDLEVKATAPEDNGKKISVSVSTTKSTTATVTGKRQRTLMEMVSSGAKAKDSDQPTKKPKLVRNSSSSRTTDEPSSSPPKPVIFGLQPLNSIPFSMQAFKDSLTEEQKGLLLLECETMGKSW